MNDILVNSSFRQIRAGKERSWGAEISFYRPRHGAAGCAAVKALLMDSEKNLLYCRVVYAARIPGPAAVERSSGLNVAPGHHFERFGKRCTSRGACQCCCQFVGERGAGECCGGQD